MKEFDFPYSGFNVCWRFEHPHYFLCSDEELKKRESELLFEDLRKILKTTIKHELFFPEYIDGIKFNYKSIDDLIDQIEKHKKEQGNFYIDSIDGYGVVKLPNGEKVKQRNLIDLDDFRLRERIYHLSTNKSIWVPISIDLNYEYKLQTGLADLNSIRLTNCLNEIYSKLCLPVEPTLESIEKDFGPFWVKDFKIFISPELLDSTLKEMNLSKSEFSKYKIDA